MSDNTEMDSATLIAALRSDLAATGAEHNEAQKQLASAASALTAAQAEHAEALADVARLEAARQAASMPDAEIRAGAHALRQKFAALLGIGKGTT
jgi:hypothetical protein